MAKSCKRNTDDCCKKVYEWRETVGKLNGKDGYKNSKKQENKTAGASGARIQESAPSRRVAL